MDGEMDNVEFAESYEQLLEDTYDYMYAHRTIGTDGGEDEDSEASKNRKWVHDAWISAKLYLEKLNSDDPPSVDEQDERRQIQEGHLHELEYATHGSMEVTQHTVDLIISLLDEEDAQYYAEDGSIAGSEYSAASTIPDQHTAVEQRGGRRKRRSSRKRRKTKRRRKKRRKKKRYTKKSVKRRRRRRRTTRRK